MSIPEQEVTVSQINLVTKVFVDNQSHNNLVTPTPVPCSQSMFSSSIKWSAALVSWERDLDIKTGHRHLIVPEIRDRHKESHGHWTHIITERETRPREETDELILN